MSKDKNKQPYKCIYNQQLAGFLMLNKQPLQRMERNLDLPWRNVFLFNDTEEVEHLMFQYKQISKEKKKNGINITPNSCGKDDSTNT